MNKTKVMISGERQKVMQKAVRWPCGICSRGIGNICPRQNPESRKTVVCVLYMNTEQD